jgi:hypothetical protein
VATSWVLPLSNFVLDHWPLPEIYPPELSNHPLRIYPTPTIPTDLSDEDLQIAIQHVHSRNRLLRFSIGNQPGFIEQLPDYSRRIRRLRSGKVANVITAVMVGTAHVQSVSFADYDTLFPLDILSLLTLATGIPVGAPWIEFRDAEGKLARRIHICFGRAAYGRGHPG